MSQALLHALDPRVHDADVRLETVRVEQQAEPACLLGDAYAESGCSTLPSRKNGTQRHAANPRSQARGPGAAVSQSMNATGTPARKTVFHGKSSFGGVPIGEHHAAYVGA